MEERNPEMFTAVLPVLSPPTNALFSIFFFLSSTSPILTRAQFPNRHNGRRTETASGSLGRIPEAAVRYVCNCAYTAIYAPPSPHSVTSPPPQLITITLTYEFLKPPTALEGLVDARQKLESQQQENEGVQSEFASLDEDSNIYKLVGPVLLKQDKNEAVMAVNGRLEFIEKEMYVRCFT